MDAAFSFEEFYRQIPIVTKTYVTGCVLTSLAVFLELVSHFDLYLNWRAVTKKMEIWRLVTNFFFYDRFDINFFFIIYFLYRYSRNLEESSFRGRTADYVWMLLLGAFTLLGINYILFLWQYNVPFLGPSIPFMIVYVWSRRNPSVLLNFLGLLTFSAPYLPFVMLGFGVILGHSPIFDILGIVVGHLYYFFEDVYPLTSNRRLLQTPSFFKAIFEVGAQQQQQPLPGQGQQLRPPVPPQQQDQQQQQ